MDYQGSTCVICFEEYGQGDRLPRIIPDCGHTLCSKCLSGLLQSPNPRCPLDNISFPQNKTTLDDFKVNFSLKHLLDEKNEGTCPQHQEKLRLFCHTDKVQICDDCALFGEHVGHKIEPIKQVRPKIEKNRKNAEEALKLLEQHDTEVAEIFDKSEENFLKTVRDRFSQLKWLCESKEAELETRILSYFSAQRNRLKENQSGNKQLKDDLIKKMQDYKNLLSSSNSSSLIEEDGSALVSKVDAGALKQKATSFEQSFKGFSDSFDELLLNQITAISKLSLPFQDISEVINKNFEEEKAAINNNDNQDHLKTITHFQLKRLENILEITANEKGSKETKIDTNILKGVNHVKLYLGKWFNTRIEVSSLFHIISEIDKLSHIEITCNPKRIVNDTIKEVLPLIFWKTKDLKSLKIDLAKSEIGDEGVVSIMKDLIPKLTGLESFSLNLSGTAITDKTIIPLVEEGLDIVKKLRCLELDFERTAITEDAISELFIPMPNMKRFSLSLMSTNVGDNAIEMFAKKCLPTMTMLESYKILLALTPVTDRSIMHLFTNLHNVKELVLGFGYINMTRKTLEVLAKEGLPAMKNLEDLELRFSSNEHVNDDSIAGILECITSMTLKSLALSLFQTGVTDKGLAAIADAIMPSIETLKAFELWLMNPNMNNVSNIGLLALFEVLPDLEELILNIWNSKATDKAGVELLDNVIPRMQNLAKLGIRLENTHISKEIIEQLAAKVKLINKNA